MEISSIIIGLVLLGASVAYVSLPFRAKRRQNTNTSKTYAQSKGQREAVLAAVRDLDFDFKTGKISEEDYQPLRAQLIAEAAQFIEAEIKEDAQLEELIQTRRTMQRLDLKCQDCGSPIETDQRFCSKCGSAVNKEKCPSCGKKIQADDLFCSSCGNKIRIHIEALAQS